MPKKFKGENTKAAEARGRKNAKKEQEETQKRQEAEDEYWRDDDRNIAKKQMKKEEKERKKMEIVLRKQENRALLEREVVEEKSTGSSKMTQAEIRAHQERELAEKRKEEELKKLEAKRIVVIDDGAPLEENFNRLQFEGDQARTVDQAITILGDKSDDVDKHPEKRMRAAFSAFEEDNMPRLKSQHPTFRLSQLKQMLYKEWLKSPENPINQRLLQS